MQTSKTFRFSVLRLISGSFCSEFKACATRGPFCRESNYVLQFSRSQDCFLAPLLSCHGNLFEVTTITMTLTLSDEGSSSNTLSVKLACRQLGRRKRCKQSISEAIREQHASTIWRKGALVRDFENFNFLGSETLRTGEKRVPAQSGVVGVPFAKVESVTVAVCAAAIGNTNVNKCGPQLERQSIASSFFSVFNANLRAEKLCGFFSVKMKLFRLGSALEQLFSFPFFPFHTRDSHSTGVNPPKMFPSVSKITVSVFGCPSQRS
jgi:hypothetical protein